MAMVQGAMQFIYLETTLSEPLFTIHLLTAGRGAAAPSASTLGFGFIGASAVHGWPELLMCRGESVGFCDNTGNHGYNLLGGYI